VFGEVGLTGRLRGASQADRRLEECAKLGLEAVIAPVGTAARGKMEVLAVDTLRRAIAVGLSAQGSEAAGT
jgi:predicted ATP-dependent serine protease